MYLSRIVLNARSRQARGWLSDCHALHRVVMSGFPEMSAPDARAALGVLYRVEPMTSPPEVVVLVQSRVEPRWTFESGAIIDIGGPKPLNALLQTIEAGRRYRFRLRANPTRRVHRRATLGPDSGSGRKQAEKESSTGKRVELIRAEDQVAWLRRKGERAGFALLETRLPPDNSALSLLVFGSVKTYGRQSSRQLTLATVLFDGVLEVTDAAPFRDAVLGGIGPGKAFGCGLLSISPGIPPAA